MVDVLFHEVVDIRNHVVIQLRAVERLLVVEDLDLWQWGELVVFQNLLFHVDCSLLVFARQVLVWKIRLLKHLIDVFFHTIYVLLYFLLVELGVWFELVHLFDLLR